MKTRKDTTVHNHKLDPTKYFDKVLSVVYFPEYQSKKNNLFVKKIKDFVSNKAFFFLLFVIGFCLWLRLFYHSHVMSNVNAMPDAKSLSLNNL